MHKAGLEQACQGSVDCDLVVPLVALGRDLVLGQGAVGLEQDLHYGHAGLCAIEARTLEHVFGLDLESGLHACPFWPWS